MFGSKFPTYDQFEKNYKANNAGGAVTDQPQQQRGKVVLNQDEDYGRSYAEL